jgi:hypothetical protein
MVFSPGRIGRPELKKRLVRSATYENAARNREKLPTTWWNFIAARGIGFEMQAGKPIRGY